MQRLLKSFELIDDFDASVYLLDINNPLVIVCLKDASTNPFSIMQRILGCENTQIMTVRQLCEIKGKISKAIYL